MFKIKMMESQKPKTEEMELEFLLRRSKNDDKKEEVEWPAEAIMNACYYDYSCTRVLATVQGKYLGLVYVIDWNKDRPIEGFPIARVPTTQMNFFEDSFLILAFKDGSLQLRHRGDLKLALQIKTHDRDTGAVMKVAINHEKKNIMSVAADGTFFSYFLDLNAV